MAWILDGPEAKQQIFRTKIDAHLWHRRMCRCNARALKQLLDKVSSGVKFDRNIDSGDRDVCSIAKSKKISHPPTDRPRSLTRLEVVHVDLWGKHPVVSQGGCQSLVAFTDDKSRMRCTGGVAIKSKDEDAEALEMVIQDVADPIKICIGKIRCDGGAEFQGRFQALC